MSMIINKSKFLTPKIGKVIRNIMPVEQKGIEMVKNIAKEFGKQSKKNKPKKIFIR